MKNMNDEEADEEALQAANNMNRALFRGCWQLCLRLLLLNCRIRINMYPSKDVLNMQKYKYKF